MARAFIVMGACSSGTKLAVRILQAAGCEGGLLERKTEDLALPNAKVNDAVLHSHDYYSQIGPIILQARKLGYAPYAIICTRNMHALSCSAVLRMHYPTCETALAKARQAYERIFHAVLDLSVPFAFASYESNVHEGWRAVNPWLALLGLGPVPEEKRFPLTDENSKHYAEV